LPLRAFLTQKKPTTITNTPIPIVHSFIGIS
jgi:hypothetical protein